MFHVNSQHKMHHMLLVWLTDLVFRFPCPSSIKQQKSSHPLPVSCLFHVLLLHGFQWQPWFHRISTDHGTGPCGTYFVAAAPFPSPLRWSTAQRLAPMFGPLDWHGRPSWRSWCSCGCSSAPIDGATPTHHNPLCQALQAAALGALPTCASHPMDAPPVSSTNWVWPWLSTGAPIFIQPYQLHWNFTQLNFHSIVCHYHIKLKCGKSQLYLLWISLPRSRPQRGHRERREFSRVATLRGAAGGWKAGEGKTCLTVSIGGLLKWGFPQIIHAYRMFHSNPL